MRKLNWDEPYETFFPPQRNGAWYRQWGVEFDQHGDPVGRPKQASIPAPPPPPPPQVPDPEAVAAALRGGGSVWDEPVVEEQKPEPVADQAAPRRRGRRKASS